MNLILYLDFASLYICHQPIYVYSSTLNFVSFEKFRLQKTCNGLVYLESRFDWLIQFCQEPHKAFIFRNTIESV